MRDRVKTPPPFLERAYPAELSRAVATPKMNPANTRHPFFAAITAVGVLSLIGWCVKITHQTENRIAQQTQAIIHGRAFYECTDELFGNKRITSASRPEDITNAGRDARCTYIPNAP